MPSRKSRKKLKSNSKAVVSGRTKHPAIMPSRKSQKKLKSNSKAVVRGRTTFCMICQRNFTSKKLLNNHNNKHHFLRHCPNCSKTFQQTRKYILHLRSHLEDHPYVCRICSESFNEKKALLNHKEFHKTDNSYSYRCDICPEVFPHISARNIHLLAHKGPPYPCYECGAIFTNISDTIVHAKNHLRRCKMCPDKVVAFGTNVDFTAHLCRVHQRKEYDHSESDTKPADKLCISTGAVKLEDDGDSDSMDEVLSSSDDESDCEVDLNYNKDAVEPVYNLKRKDKFICFICYDLYPSPELLKLHMKPHKWYPCNSCPRFFPNAIAFEKHKCDFAEVPSFICNICGAKIECENCKKNCNKSMDTAEINENSLQDIAPTFPGMPKSPILNYCDAADRNWLSNFIQHIKCQKGPVDVKTFSFIVSQTAVLGLIFEDPRVRSLYPDVYISDIEELYSKFLEVSQILCSGMNHL